MDERVLSLERGVNTNLHAKFENIIILPSLGGMDLYNHKGLQFTSQLREKPDWFI